MNTASSQLLASPRLATTTPAPMSSAHRDSICVLHMGTSLLYLRVYGGSLNTLYLSTKPKASLSDFSWKESTCAKNDAWLLAILWFLISVPPKNPWSGDKRYLDRGVGESDDSDSDGDGELHDQGLYRGRVPGYLVKSCKAHPRADAAIHDSCPCWSCDWHSRLYRGSGWRLASFHAIKRDITYLLMLIMSRARHANQILPQYLVDKSKLLLHAVWLALSALPRQLGLWTVAQILNELLPRCCGPRAKSKDEPQGYFPQHTKAVIRIEKTKANDESRGHGCFLILD